LSLVRASLGFPGQKAKHYILEVEEENTAEEKQPIIPSKSVWKVLAIEFFLFSLTLGLGILTASRAFAEIEKHYSKLPRVSIGEFIVHFLIATAFLFLIIRVVTVKKRKKALFKFLFTAAVFLGGWTTLNIWIGDLPSLVLMTTLIVWWWKKPSVIIQDACVVLAIAGTGSLLGLSFNPEVVVILLALFSLYDIVAVYKTKHMVKLAKEMIESKAVLGLIIPQDFLGFKSSLQDLQPGGKMLILGGGDIVFPLFLCASLVPSEGLSSSLVVALFSLAGLTLSFYLFLSQEDRKPIPALPPIAFSSIMGFLMVRLFNFLA